jgi:alpha-tubulin suppressor-like RCC1 family protein
MGDDLPVVDLGTGRTAKMISAGGEHTCALLDDDSVKCWGRNQYGQLGLGDTSNRGDGPGEMGDNLPVVDLGTYVGNYGRGLRVIS